MERWRSCREGGRRGRGRGEGEGEGEEETLADQWMEDSQRTSMIDVGEEEGPCPVGNSKGQRSSVIYTEQPQSHDNVS